jgi:phytoene/squalene synthetase
LAAFGLTYADIEAKVHDERFQALMAHLVSLTRNLFVSAWPTLCLLSRTGRFVAGAGGVYYCSVLKELERRNYDVYEHSVHFSSARKLQVFLTGWPAIVWPEARRPI